MIGTLKSGLKRSLAYSPLAETEPARSFVERARTPGMPYCPVFEGDLLHALISRHRLKRCLETGFGTGSTAIYMLYAVAPHAGDVVSIDRGANSFNEIGRANLEAAGMAGSHQLIEENSNRAIPRLYLDGERFDLIFVDGWKTFDHLAFEIYQMVRMLNVGGFMVFDDSQLPGVRQAIRLLERFYWFDEIRYADYGQGLALRIYLALTTRHPVRPYRALRKAVDESAIPATRDWTFHRPT